MSTQSRTLTRVAVRAQSWVRHPLLPFVGILIALLAALAVFIPALNPPSKDTRLLILFLTASGMLTVLGTTILYRLGLVHWFRSLSWTLLVTIFLTVQLIFFNVWITARLMFISTHDLWLTTALLVFAGLTAIIVGVFIANTITDRVRQLTQAAAQVAHGNLETRVTIPGSDELAELAITFNWMASNLQEIDDQRRQLEQTRRSLIAWVSHDLRTPLASMRAMIEAMADGVVTDPATQARYLATTQAEIEHLSRLINDLFELAQLDVGHLKLAYEPTALRDLVSDTLGSMHPQAEQRAVTLTGRVQDSIDTIPIAPDKIQRVLYNLIDNALDHTPSGGAITLNAHRVLRDIQIDVHNTGSYIEPTDLPHVFDSFYRGEHIPPHPERTRRGAGLGLAIARGFVEAHGGRIWVTSHRDQGTTFSFTLPLTPAPHA